MAHPRLRVTSITIGTPDPREFAHFYARLLEITVTVDEDPGPEEPAQGGWAQLRAPGGPTLNFEYERHFRRPVWPATARAQTATQHLDIHVDDMSTAVEHAVSCGAVLADAQPQEGVRVLIDPHGHPFCLFQ